MENKLRAAIVGCGAIGEIHARAISASGGEVAAVFDSRAEAAEAMAKRWGCGCYTDYDSMLRHEALDAAALCVPSGLHSALAEPAARAGKHIICEKPLDTSLERAQRLVDLCRSHGVGLYPIFQHRFDPAVTALKKALDEGRLGKLYWGSAHVVWYRDDAYYRAAPWRGTFDMDGGVLMNQSIHSIDLLLHFMGTPESVSGMCAARRGIFEAEDVGIGSIRFESGALGSVEGTTDAKPGLYNEISLYGEKGSVIMRNDAIFYVNAPDAPELASMADPDAAYTKYQSAAIAPEGHIRQYKDIISAIRTGSEPYVTAQSALQTVKTILAIRQSSREGKSIPV